MKAMVNTKLNVERKLSVLYFAVCGFQLLLSILMGIIWNYWRYTLNTCIDSNCGCLLYATTTYNAFTGADVSICRLVTFAPLIGLLWALLFGSYHSYRVCILKARHSSHGGRRPTVTFHTPPETRVPPPPKTRKSPLYICLFIMSLAFVLLFIAITFIVTDGYYTACKGYRKAVVKQLSANGNLAAMVYERMTCGSIFDFLDYMQPDPIFLESRFRRGTLIINTGVLLQISIIAAWISLVCWIFISYFNALSIYKNSKKFLCIRK